MTRPLIFLSAAGFVIAFALQLILNDIPGAFVVTVVAPIAGWLTSRMPWPRHLTGLVPLASSTLGYFVSRVVEGSLFVMYGGIASMFAIGLFLVASVIYAATFVIARPRRLR